MPFISMRPNRSERHRLLAAVLGAALLLASCAGDDTIYDLENGASADGEADYSFYIPAGTGDRLDQGLPVEIMPNWMLAKVGETIELVNDDDRGHLVGPFYVGARETLRQRFPAEGQYEGVCTVHPSGQIVVIVTA
jgi:hypothetical protein